MQIEPIAAIERGREGGRGGWGGEDEDEDEDEDGEDERVVCWMISHHPMADATEPQVRSA
jgi:hypothetical protein